MCLWVKIFVDRNQICRNLLSNSIACMLSNLVSSNSIASLSVSIHIFQISLHANRALAAGKYYVGAAHARPPE